MKLDDENWHVLTVSRRDPETGEYTMEKAPLYHLVDADEDKSSTKKVTKAPKKKPARAKAAAAAR